MQRIERGNERVSKSFLTTPKNHPLPPTFQVYKRLVDSRPPNHSISYRRRVHIARLSSLSHFCVP